MNLKKLNVVALTTEELRKSNGGIWWLLAEIAYEIVYSQDDIKKGYAAGKAFINSR